MEVVWLDSKVVITRILGITLFRQKPPLPLFLKGESFLLLYLVNSLVFFSSNGGDTTGVFYTHTSVVTCEIAFFFRENVYGGVLRLGEL